MNTAGVIGLHLVSGIFVGLGIGYLLDKFLDTKPIFILIFLLLGIFAGFNNVYRDAKKLLKDNDLENEGTNGAEHAEKTMKSKHKASK